VANDHDKINDEIRKKRFILWEMTKKRSSENLVDEMKLFLKKVVRKFVPM